MAKRKPRRGQRRTLPPPPARANDLAMGAVGTAQHERHVSRTETVDVVNMADPDGRLVSLHRVRDRLLDALHASGWVSRAQHNAGCELRDLWASAGVRVGAKIAVATYGGGAAHDAIADLRAYQQYVQRLRLVPARLRATLVAVVIHDEWRDGYRLADITAALDAL